MNKYYDMNTAAEDAAKNAQPTPCEMFNKMRTMEREREEMLMRFSRKCKERDDVMRTLDQTTVKLNDETARADALQRRCDDLEKSRQAWVRKCEALTGQLQETMKAREYYERRAQEAYSFYHEVDDENKLLRNHPWKNLWAYIKEALGVG